MKTIALITAGGKGERMQSPTAKQFLLLGGKPILAQTIAVFEACPVVDEIFVIVPQDEMAKVQKDIVEKYQYKKVLKVVRGGRIRQQSVWNGLRAIKSDCSWVVVHDGVRPLITPQLIEAGLREARQTGAASVAVPARDTVKRLAPGGKLQTLPREEIWLAQTPQIFEFSLLCRAHQKASQEKFTGTDDASLVERLGQAVSLVPGNCGNIKITTPEDLTIAETLIKKGEKSPVISPFRVGLGYDVHRLVPERALILGGIEIPHSLGLEGHSDADVLAHALGDALLGAAGLGDLGRHFPDSDPQYKGVSSLILLKTILSRIRSEGWKIGYLDSTIVAQQPKLADFVPSMRQALAESLQISADQIHIKATTTEGLGFCGRREGIAAYAVALLNQ